VTRGGFSGAGRAFAGLLLACLLGVATAGAASSGVREVWKASYDGGDVDFLNDMSVDAAGNVYVTGESYRTFHDILTVKYDPQGAELWTARYDGPGQRHDAGSAVAVDSAGNVYVTGSTENGNGVPDYVTLKYGPNGQLLWERRYDGGAGHYDAAADLVLDGAGDVYVTGQSDAGSQWGDYLTIKYSSDGAELWTARTSGIGGHHDRPGMVRLDAAGNVYVAGEIYVSQQRYYDFGTVKYDSGGRELWVRTYDSPEIPGGLDSAYAMEVDAAGNVHVTGESLGDGNGCCTQDWATLKYDTAGKLLWERRHEGSTEGQDIPGDLTLDRVGNVIVTGQTTNQTHDVGTIKYSPAGNVLWKTILDLGGLDEGAGAVTTDRDGNVYVAGFRDDRETYSDWHTFRLNRNGKLAWSIRHDGLSSFIDTPAEIAVHGRNVVYVAGSSWAELPDYMTIKYRQTRR
jgi:hypothetical protein